MASVKIRQNVGKLAKREIKKSNKVKRSRRKGPRENGPRQFWSRKNGTKKSKKSHFSFTLLSLFLYFGDFEPRCSYEIVQMQNKMK